MNMSERKWEGATLGSMRSARSSKPCTPAERDSIVFLGTMV